MSQTARDAALINQIRHTQKLVWEIQQEVLNDKVPFHGDVSKVDSMLTRAIVMCHPSFVPFLPDDRIDDITGISMDSFYGDAEAMTIMEFFKAESARLSLVWPRLARQAEASPTRGLSAKINGIDLRVYTFSGRVVVTIADPHKDIDVTWVGEEGHPERGLGLHSVHASLNQAKRLVTQVTTWNGDLESDQDMVIA